MKWFLKFAAAGLALFGATKAMGSETVAGVQDKTWSAILDWVSKQLPEDWGFLAEGLKGDGSNATSLLGALLPVLGLGIGGAALAPTGLQGITALAAFGMAVYTAFTHAPKDAFNTAARNGFTLKPMAPAAAAQSVAPTTPAPPASSSGGATTPQTTKASYQGGAAMSPGGNAAETAQLMMAKASMGASGLPTVFTDPKKIRVVDLSANHSSPFPITSKGAAAQVRAAWVPDEAREGEIVATAGRHGVRTEPGQGHDDDPRLELEDV